MIHAINFHQGVHYFTQSNAVQPAAWGGQHKK